MGIQLGDLRGFLDKIISVLKQIQRQTESSGCCPSTTSAGTTISVPAGFGSVAIVQTSAGEVDITLSDGSVFSMTVLGETFVDAAAPNRSLPAYTISGTATWKWHGIK